MRVDLLDVSSGILSDDKASYHRPTGSSYYVVGNHYQFASGEPKYLIIDTFCSIQLNNLTQMDLLVTFIYILPEGFK